MKKFLFWFLFSKKKSFSIFFYSYKIIYLFILKKYPKILDLVYFDNNKKYKKKYVETKLGKYLVFSNDGGISRQIYINKNYNFNSLERVVKLIGKKNLLVDVGANIGPTCIAAIKKRFFKKCIAFEPEINSYNLLKQNIYLNNFQKKINTFNLAVSDKNSFVKLSRKQGNYGASFIKNSTSTKKVKSIILDKFKNLFDKNCLIWVDVQGYEEKVLKGAKILINKNIPIVIEFYPDLMKKFSSKNEIINVLQNFKFFYDLKDKKIYKQKTSKTNLNNLYDYYNKKKATELLLINS